MTTKNDGGPAFPLANGPDTGWAEGMTLRDYFAAKAMQGLLAQSVGTAVHSPMDQGAEYAYAMADAMLAAREAAPEQGDQQ